VRVIIDEAYTHTVNLLRENRDKLTALAELLLQEEVVNQREVMEVIGVEWDTENADIILGFDTSSDAPKEPEVTEPDTVSLPSQNGVSSNSNDLFR
jgi:hypothetical protein